MASKQVKQLQIAEKEIIRQILTEYSNVLSDYLYNNNRQQVIQWQQATNRKYGAVMFELGTEIFQTYRTEAGLERYEWIFHDEVMEQVLREANRQGYSATWKGLNEGYDLSWLEENYENNVRAWGRNAGLSMAKSDDKCKGYYLELSPTACDWCKELANLNFKYESMGMGGLNKSKDRLEQIFHTNCKCNWRPAWEIVW